MNTEMNGTRFITRENDSDHLLMREIPELTYFEMRLNGFDTKMLARFGDSDEQTEVQIYPETKFEYGKQGWESAYTFHIRYKTRYTGFFAHELRNPDEAYERQLIRLINAILDKHYRKRLEPQV